MVKSAFFGFRKKPLSWENNGKIRDFFFAKAPPKISIVSYPARIKLSHSKLTPYTMAAQRKGLWKDCSVLLFFDRRLLSLSSLFLEQHFPRRFSLVVFVLRYSDVYSLTSSVIPPSAFDAHSILRTETASRSLYSPCIRRHDMQNCCLQRVLKRLF